MQKERLYASQSAGDGLVEAGEFVVIDPENPGILVGRWLDWRHLPAIMKDRRSLLPASAAPPFPPPALAPAPPAGRRVRHLTVLGS